MYSTIWEYPEPKDPAGGDFSPIYIRYSEYEILLLCWCFWSNEVFHKRPDNTFEIVPDNCVDDWIITNWAYQAEEQL